QFLVLRHRIMLEDFSLEDPDLHSAGAVRGEGGRYPIIDVGPQRVQRHASFAIPLHARDFRPAEAARAVDADAFGTETHCRLNRALHGAAECDTTLELLRDRFRNQLRVQLGLADLNDIDDDIPVRELGNSLPQVLDVGSLLADDYARAGRVDGHAALLVRPLDDDMRHRCLLELLHQLLADLDVLVEQRAVFRLTGEPARIPGAVDADTQPDRIDFLTHRVLLKLPPAPRPDAQRWSGQRTALKSVRRGRGRGG